MDTKKLIEEVLLDLGNGKSLDEISTKVRIIAHLLKNEEFTQWVNHELFDGYNSKNDLPEYRCFQIVSLKADYLQPNFGGFLSVPNQVIPLGSLSDKERTYITTVKLTDSAPTIQGYMDKEGIAYSVNDYELSLIQRVLPGCQIMRARKELSISSFKRIVEVVKGKLIDTFMELNDSVFSGSLELKSLEARAGINQIITNNITAGIFHSGTGDIVTNDSFVANTINQGLSLEEKQTLRDLTDKIEAIAKDVEEEFDDIASDIITIREELEKTHPLVKLIRNTFRAIGGWANTINQSAVSALVQEAVKMLLNKQ